MNLSDMVTTADVARLQSGGKSMFESSFDNITGAVAGSVASAVTSLYNTGAYYSNAVFGSDLEQLDTARVLNDVNANWGTYYKDHKEVLDTVGFIGGSFAPGMLAVKALKGLQTAGTFGGVFKNTLGYAANAKNAALAKGLEDMATSGPSLVGALHTNKLKAIAWGTADQTLQAAFFEIGAVTALSQSPTLKDETAGDILWDMTKNALAGGVLGGGIEALFTNKIFKNAGQAIDKELRKSDLTKAFESLDVSFGDSAFKVIDSVLDLPESLLKAERKISFNYTADGKKLTTDLDIGHLLDKKSKEAADHAILKVQSAITNIVQSDTSVGKSFAAGIANLAREGYNGNQPVEAIRKRLGDLLFNLDGVQGMGGTNIDLAKDVIYFSPGGKFKNLEEALQSVTTTRVKDNQLGYRLTGDWSDVSGAVIGPKFGTLDDAFKNGIDVAIMPDGQFHVNPLSEKIKRVNAHSDDEYLRMIYHVRSNTVQDSAMGTIADVATAGRPLTPASITSTGITSGNYTFKFSQHSFEQELEDSVKITARHAWASQKKNLEGVTINGNDFSLLSAAIEQRTRDVTVIGKSGVKMVIEDPNTLRSFVLDQKIAFAKEITKTQAIDSRTLEHILNVENGWLEKAVQSDWDKAKLFRDEATWRPLASYLERDNLVLLYNKKGMENAASMFPDGQLAYAARIQDAERHASTASAAVLGSAFTRFADLTSASTASTAGAGPSFFGASNADYFDTLKRVIQSAGQGVQQTQTEFRNAVLSPLQPLAAKVITEKNLELGAIMNKLRRTPDQMVLDRENKRLVDLAYWEHMKRQPTDELAKPAIAIGIEKQSTFDFLAEYQRTHAEWDAKNRVLAAAAGKSINYHPDQFYIPPVNTRHYPYFAFVRDVEGRAFSEGGVSMITARTPEELKTLIDTVQKDHPSLQVITKDQNIAYHKAKGDYEYASGLNSPDIDSALRKQGKLGDFMPTLEPTAVINEFVDFIGRREDGLVRNAVSLKYSNVIAELKSLSERYTTLGKSKLQYIGKSEARKVDDPFGDHIRLLLNVPKDAEYTFWHDANAFVDSLGQRAYKAAERAYMQARRGEKTFEEANAEMTRLGLGSPFKDQEAYITAQIGGNGNLLKSAIAKGNGFLATVGLRLDMANALVNTLATPGMLMTELSSIRNSLKMQPEVWQEINQMMTVKVPGQEFAVPSNLRLFGRAIQNYWGADRKLLTARYEGIGTIKNLTSQFHEMISDMALLPNMNRSEWAKKVEKATERGATITGNNWAEEFTRFVSSDIMRQITDPLVSKGLMKEAEQNTFMQVFTNRVQGNYVASQRPIAFQGTLGAALSLFQTYQFNLLQQLFRHIENKDARTLAIAASLQTTMFGLSGLPMFDAINTHLIGNASINEQHHDAYSSMVRFAGKEWGDWLMYGTASALPIFSDKAPALYTRGDLNPRHITILPNPMNPSEIPVVAGLTRVVSAIYGSGKQIVNGADISSSLLFGLEHNGVSRPLAGFAQVLQGYSTTSKGGVIAANNDAISIASASRLIGAKPMDESLALNHMYRLNAYKANDRDRIEKLGTAVKQKIRDGSMTAEDQLELMGRYAAIGGKVEGYTQALQRWNKDAKQSVVNKVMEAHRSPTGQRLLEVMGADPLDDLEGQ